MKSSLYAVLFLAFFAVVSTSLTLEAAVSSKSAEPKHAWKPFGSDQEGNNYSYDPDTIQRTANKNVKVWIKAEYSEKKSNLKEAQLLWEIDCSKKSFRGITAYSKRKDGTSVTLDKPSEWSAIPAESTMETLSDLICEQPKKTK